MFWDDPYIEALEAREKLVFIYLLTNRFTNLAGIYEITLRRIAFHTGISEESVYNILQKFEKDKKVFYFYDENFVFLTNFLKNQRMNTNMKIHVEKLIASLPEPVLQKVFRNGLVTVTQWLPNGWVKKEEGRRKKEEGSMKKEEGRKKKEVKKEEYLSEKVSENPSDLSVPDSPKHQKKQKKEPQNPYHGALKKIFLKFFKEEKGVDFYWAPKEATALNQLTEKMKFSISGAGHEVNEDSVTTTFWLILRKNPDSWINENLSVTILNSKYNEIIAKIKQATGSGTSDSLRESILSRLRTS